MANDSRLPRLSAGLLLAFILVSAAFAADRKTYPMDIPAEGVRTISFDVQEGDFVLRGDPEARAVQMRVSIDRFWVFKLGEEGILKRLIKITGEGTDHLTIATDIPRAISNWGRAQYPIDFEVVVPAGAKVELRDASGIISVSDMSADVSITDGSGTLAASRLQGALRVTKESGDIRVDDVTGAVRIASQSGQLRLRNLGELDIERSDGNIDLAQSRTAHLRSNGGNIRANGVQGDLRIDDESGEIVVTDVTGKVEIHDTSGQIRIARTGAVVIYDTSGDVTARETAGLRIVDKESGKVNATDISGSVEVPARITLQQK
ncbi:MAG: DUF4097 family beta strand repeat-containing protein [Terriglobales bacterium]